ncbi:MULTISPECIES: DUF3397 domain-containing protein [Bacillaceae]|uniref:DUF3397 domain-containing protein n=1 Tax=Evansella alkalicola TaxID=745819 RepID=A0ABS6JPP0_9BACI|nr:MULTISPECIES: DUF3397 domain-containing protein [Bacillaceae]MBU9720453.1 DUF3397 domain-containing protein [Bacillus alkalicola]
MSEVFVFIAATLVTVPLLGLYLVYLVAVKSTRNKLFSIKLAVDCTTLLFMIAVYFIILQIWNLSLTWLFILFFLLSGIIFTFVHWKLYEDINIQKVMKGVWRFQFFVFFFLYFVLIFLGVIVTYASAAGGR